MENERSSEPGASGYSMAESPRLTSSQTGASRYFSASSRTSRMPRVQSRASEDSGVSQEALRSAISRGIGENERPATSPGVSMGQGTTIQRRDPREGYDYRSRNAISTAPAASAEKICRHGCRMPPVPSAAVVEPDTRSHPANFDGPTLANYADEEEIPRVCSHQSGP